MGMLQSTDGLEKQLLDLLRFSGIEKDNLQELVAIVVGFKSNGLGPFRIFPRGIPPVVDGLTVQATVSKDNISQILSLILTNPFRLHGVVIFPYGIPNVESFLVNVSLGNTVEAGTVSETGA